MLFPHWFEYVLTISQKLLNLAYFTQQKKLKDPRSKERIPCVKCCVLFQYVHTTVWVCCLLTYSFCLQGNAVYNHYEYLLIAWMASVGWQPSFRFFSLYFERQNTVVCTYYEFTTHFVTVHSLNHKRQYWCQLTSN